MNTYHFVFPHSMGSIVGRFSEQGLRELDLGAVAPASAANGAPERVRSWMEALRGALERYFAGTREDFNGFPLDLDGATPFRRTVWETARTVPWGTASSYGDLAARMGRSRGSARAVGQALGANPVPIVVPCHRFLASDGSLGGFSCGLPWKCALLRVEGIGFHPPA